MRVLLIHPVKRLKALTVEARRRVRQSTGYPGLGLFAVAALTPPEVDVKIVDESVDDIPSDFVPDLVGISVLTHSALYAYEMSAAYRQRGIPVVLGGIHPSLNPDEAVQHADAVVVGEAELTWPALIDDFQNGRMKKRYEKPGLPDLDAAPIPRRELLNRSQYQVPNVVQASKGCPFDCEFCCLVPFVDYKMRFRNIDRLVEEIRALPPGPLMFVDDNLYANRSYSRDLCRALAPLKRKWVGESTWHIAFDDETMRLAKDAGCMGLFVGFDSIQPQHMVRKVPQGRSAEDVYVEATRNLQRNGLAVVAAFVFGFDNDDPGVFERTFKVIRRSSPDLVNFSVLTPYPGTPAFDRLDREGRIKHRNWSKYVTPNVVFEPKGMTARELVDGTRWMHDQFFSLSHLGKTAFQTGFKVGWGMSMIALKLNLARRRNISLLEAADTVVCS
jgi:radical SAM superfamily enzyme YgiQ (UPF0313 family)